MIRIDRNRTLTHLGRALAGLYGNRERIAGYAERMRRFADRNLWSWDERIDYEIGLLERLARGRRIAATDMPNGSVHTGGKTRCGGAGDVTIGR